MSDKKVVDVILHCQKQIKKDRLPEEKLLHYLGRLSRLRITVHELAETGIGRTVNSLSRNEGPVGQAADTLVRGWKRMVSEQQNQADQDSEEESDSNSGTSEEDEETRKCDDEGSYELDHGAPPETAQSHQFSSSQSSTDEGRGPIYSDGNHGYDEEGEDDIDDIDDPIMENGYLDLANVHTDEEEEEEDDDEDNDSDGSDRLQIADEGQNGRHVNVKQEVVVKQENDYYDDDEAYDSYQEKSHAHQRSRENGERKNHETNVHQTDRSHSSQSSSSSKESSRKEHRHHSSKSKEESKDRSNKHGDHHHKSHSHHHSSSKSDKPKESKSEHYKSHKDKEKHRSKEHREKHKEVKSPEKDRKSEKDKKDSSSSHHHSKDKGQEQGSSHSHSPKKSSLDLRRNEHNEEKKRGDDHESSHPSSSKKSKVTYKEEIDSTSGIDFADALGCLDASASKHKKPKRVEPEKINNKHESKAHGSGSHPHKSESSKKHENSSSKHSRERPSSSSSKISEKDSDRKSKSKAQSKIESVIQPAVNISPNYRPINSSLATISRPSSSTNGLTAPISITQADLADIGSEFYENSRGNPYEVSQEDAISTMLSNRNRNARSKVYSGIKSARHGLVPSLFDQCMQVIKDNIGDLGYTGGIPYDILKPALERANPQQLINIETQNDYLIGETDELWQFHCKRDFRGKFPDETESWRELYERCKEEQQLRFEKIKSQMKRSIASAEPVRKAKLAYVDTSCGPRFNLAKAKTIKDGMKTLKIKEEKGPGRGVSSSASAGFNNPKRSGGDNVKVEEASCIIAPDSRSGHAPAPPVSRESVAAKLKPKKAPLMQKTMKLIRSLNRR